MTIQTDVFARSRRAIPPVSTVSTRLANRARSTISPALVVACLGAVNVLWLIRFRFGQVTGWDESGYMAIAIRNTRALHDGGIASLIGEFERQNVQAPLLPLITVPVNAVFGNEVFQSLIAIQVVAAALTVATFLLARTFLSRSWSVLAAACVGSTPAVADYSREYVFSIPAALFLSGATWMLIRSDQLRQRRWVVGAGVLTGLMLLSRTMTLSFLPALFVAGVVLAIASNEPEGRRRRVRSLLWAGAALLVVAGSWYLRNVVSVAAYLLNYGYGKNADAFGESHSPASWGYWTKDVRLIAQSLYVPLALLVLASAFAALIVVVRSRVSVRMVLGSPMFVLGSVLVVGYLALTSSRNEGTGFVLPLLPPLIVLTVGSAARIGHRPIRHAFALLFAVVSVGNVAMKSSFVPALAQPVAWNIPGLGSVPVLDGRGLIQLEVAAAGFSTGGASDQLPAIDKRWLPVMRELTSFASRYAAERGQTPYIVFGSDDPIFNTTRATLTNALSGNDGARSNFIELDAGGDRVAYYRDRLDYLKPNFVEIAQRPLVGSSAGITPRYVAEAVRLLRYRPIYRFTLPDHRRASLWYREQESLTLPDRRVRRTA
jgi:4-amino-4-deoxy-L-arabinose transferase-like glycosyltransferase